MSSLRKYNGDVMQTRPYRSPEVHHLAATVGAAMDLWSVGITLGELLELRFTHVYRSSELPKAWAKYLGRGSAEEPKGERKAWPANFQKDIGINGNELLELLLEFNPAARISASAALDHAFFNPERFSLLGYQVSAGDAAIHGGSPLSNCGPASPVTL